MFMQFSDKRGDVKSFRHTECPIKKDSAAVPLGNALNSKGFKKQPARVSRDIALHRSPTGLIVPANYRKMTAMAQRSWRGRLQSCNGDARGLAGAASNSGQTRA